jgi:predicted GNAT family N-acyltransferase
MDYEITDYITPQEYMEMRKLVGWTDFPMEQAEQGLKHSAYICVFRKEGKVIALARVLTDHGYVVYIADVIVHPDFQGQGLGRALMNNVMDYIKSQLKPGYKKMVSLMAAQGKEEFYKKFGFFTRPDETHGCGMCQWIQAQE